MIFSTVPKKAVFVAFSRLFFSLLFFLLVSRNTIAEEIETLLSNAEGAYLSGDYERAISYWNEVIEKEELKSEPKKLAAVYENMASLQWHLGSPGTAVQLWQKSIDIYRKQPQHPPNLPSQLHLAAVLIDQSQAYNDLGQPRFSIPLLTEAISIVEQYTSPVSSPTKLKQIAFFALGNAYSIQTDYDRAINAYRQSLKINENLDTLLAVAIWTNLSQTYQQRAIAKEQKALAAEIEEDSKATLLKRQARSARASAIQSARMASTIGNKSHRFPGFEIRGLPVTAFRGQSLEQAKALIQLSKLVSNNRERLLVEAEDILRSLPDSYQKVYVLIHLSQVHSSSSKTVLSEAVEISDNIGNPRVTSFAKGAMGKYYEQRQQYELALYWTQQAQLAAGQAQAPDSLYQWNWQAARIYNAIGEPRPAAEAYENAIASLQSIRGDLAQAKNSHLTFDFQTGIEPVYREYLKLLLTGEPSQNNLKRALEVRQLLQLSELENFFKDDCFELESSSISELFDSLRQANTAVVTTIILNQQTHVIWQLPLVTS